MIIWYDMRMILRKQLFIPKFAHEDAHINTEKPTCRRSKA
jgi:hypothetical protein